MKKGFIIISFSFLMWGCHFFTAPGKDECDKIISREEMIAVLTDVYLMEGYLLDMQNSRPEIRDSAAFFYSRVFDKHGITYETFDEALNCYLLHREEMMAIHESILSELSIKMGETRIKYTGPPMEPLEGADTILLQQRQAPWLDTLNVIKQLEEGPAPQEFMQQSPPD
ncbi:MAG: DUF4296 domain-containing protein [Bacteroidales bacterium]